MATISETGIIPTDLQGYKNLLEDKFREEFGTSLSIDAETPAGQIISIASLMLAEADESLVKIANGMSVNTSSGIQLDDLSTLLHVARRGATFTQVVCTLTGVIRHIHPIRKPGEEGKRRGIFAYI